MRRAPHLLATALGATGLVLVGCHILAGYAGLHIGDAGGAGGAGDSGGAGGLFNPDNTCHSPSDCPADDEPCTLGSCLAGACLTELVPKGDACGAGSAEVCDGDGACVAAGGLRPNGASCGAPGQCFSGHCTDGVCCDAGCLGPCVACNAAGSEGSCRAHALDSNPEVELGGCPAPGRCDGGGACASGTFRHALALGGGGDAALVAVAVGPDGSSYLAGDYTGALAVGGDMHTSQGGHDVFLARLDAAGALVWSRSYGGAGEQHVAAIGAGAEGVYLVGHFAGQIDFGSGALVSAGGDDLFLAAIDPGGTERWSQRHGDGADQHAAALGLGPDGAALWIAGSFAGTLDLGAGPLVQTGVEDAFFAKLATTGALAWARRFGGAGSARALAVAVSQAGRSVVAGTFDGNIDFDDALPGGIVTTQGGVDLFAARFDPYGNAFGSGWPLVVGDPDDQCPAAPGGCHLALAVRTTGAHEEILFAGGFQGFLPLGTEEPALVSAGGSDVFVAMLFENGHPLWRRSLGGVGDESALAVGLDAAGNALVAGRHAGTLDLGGGKSLAGKGGDDAFVAKLATTGDTVWARSYGDGAAQRGTAVAVGPEGEVCLGGSYAGTVDLGGTSYPSAGGDDGFVVALDP
ncbi:MAG: hypothetical protein IT373_24460 [Polyangiaceae bacterium]|nr:hypothetical protein [Polyangiaceae bacterium]